MSVYFVVEIILLFFLSIQILTIDRKLRKRLFFISSLMVVILMCFRNFTVGGDIYNYTSFFVNAPSLYGTLDHPSEAFEWGFLQICRLIALISQTKFFFILFTSSFFLVPFLLLVKKNGTYLILPLLVFMIYWDLLPIAFGASRQLMAVSLFMYAYIVWDSNYKYRLVVSISLLVLSFVTHSSMLISIPLGLLAYFIKINRFNAILIVILTFLISIVAKDVFSNLFDKFYDFFSALHIADRMVNYYDNNEYSLNTNYTIGYLKNILYVISLIMMTSTAKEDNNNFQRNCLVLGCSLFCIGLSFPMISRASFLLMIIGITYIPQNIFYKKKSVYMLMLLISVLYTLFVAYLYYNNPARDAEGNRILPYLFIFE